ncbi:50S ribosomal protein L24 [Winkia sp. UMB6473-AN360BR]|uniref:50S ribosomal protein L24 n=1 Tax=Winkia sp. UMB6473-AN360BR TaxID=3050611 RepID=UPI0025553F0E|nr:50S ribosomal protein L24 [Winkia sp. UMB6473-AN360BR]MDK8817638.1 50S ribosomal protein L24 [Winkia sp. UMB6473-AN360BR]
MGAKIKKGDLVQVIAGRASDPKGARLVARNKRREAEGLEPLAPGDKGKQGRVLKVFPKENRALVEGVNVRTHHVRQGQNAQGQVTGGIEKREAPVDLSKLVLVDPSTKKPAKVGFREEEVERDGRTRTVRVRYNKATGKDI